MCATSRALPYELPDRPRRQGQVARQRPPSARHWRRHAPLGPRTVPTAPAWRQARERLSVGTGWPAAAGATAGVHDAGCAAVCAGWSPLPATAPRRLRRWAGTRGREGREGIARRLRWRSLALSWPAAAAICDPKPSHASADSARTRAAPPAAASWGRKLAESRTFAAPPTRGVRGNAGSLARPNSLAGALSRQPTCPPSRASAPSAGKLSLWRTDCAARPGSPPGPVQRLDLRLAARRRRRRPAVAGGGSGASGALRPRRAVAQDSGVRSFLLIAPSRHGPVRGQHGGQLHCCPASDRCSRDVLAGRNDAGRQATRSWRARGHGSAGGAGQGMHAPVVAVRDVRPQVDLVVEGNQLLQALGSPHTKWSVKALGARHRSCRTR